MNAPKPREGAITMRKALCAALAVLTLLCAATSPLIVPAAYAQESDGSGELSEQVTQPRYATKQINLFKKKSTTSKKLAKIAKGGEVGLIEASGNWANVIYIDEAGTELIGYVKKEYLSKKQPGADSTPSPTPSPTPDPDVTPNPDETPNPEASPTPVVTPNFPGGGRPSGGGGSSGSKATPSPMERLGITPGKALSSGHKSGNYSFLPYGAVSLRVSGEAMEELNLGGSELNITLWDASGALLPFSAAISKAEDETLLMLAPSADESALSWHVGGSAMRTLLSSGIARIVLMLPGDMAACVDMNNPFSGVSYNRLRAMGIPAGSIDLLLSCNAGEITASALCEGQTYAASLNPDGAFYACGLTVGDLDTVLNIADDTDAEG